MRASLTSVLILALVAGCVGTPSATQRPKGAKLGTAAASGAPESPDALASRGLPSAGGSFQGTPSPFPSVSLPPGSVTLSGIVTAPPGIISNNGGNIISDHGSGYRTLGLLVEQPVASVTVRLLDGAGQPLLVDGQPLTATTDATGRYAFTAALPAGNFIAAVALPGGQSELQAVVTPTGGARSTGIGLVSTLTTGYILTQYVATQADRGATLDKLPADVEATTRAIASDSLAGGTTAVPDALTPDKVVATVNSLRQANKALDDQLELVKRLLIPAGLSDLGEGRLATTVTLGFIKSVIAAPDGGVYIATRDSRIWHLRPDQRIETVAGRGSGPGAVSLDVPLTGQRGVDAEFGNFQGLAKDKQGRLLILESTIPASGANMHRLSRLEADGRLTELLSNADWPNGEFGAAVGSGPGGEVWLVTSSGFWVIGADGKKTQRVTFATSEEDPLNWTDDFGQDPQGRILLNRSYETETRRLDPATGILTLLPDVGDEGLAVDANGAIFHVTAGGQLTVDPPVGPTRTLLTKLPEQGETNDWAFDLRMFYTKGVALMPDGGAYIGQQYLLYHVKDNRITLAAGSRGATSGDASDIAIQEPSGVVALANGDLLVADSGNHRLLRVAADHTVSVVAGSGDRSRTETRKEAPALSFGFDGPFGVQRDAAGNLYLGDYAGVRRIDPAGQLTTVTDGYGEFAVTPDGVLYTSQIGTSGAVIRRKPPNGDATVILRMPKQRYSLAIDRDGSLLVMGYGELSRWTEAAGLVSLKQDARFGNVSPDLAVDATGRLYFTGDSLSTPDTLWRWDPATGAFTQVAGAGSTHFGGTGPDASINGLRAPAFAPNGDLYFCDFDHKQVKRIPASEL